MRREPRDYGILVQSAHLHHEPPCSYLEPYSGAGPELAAMGKAAIASWTGESVFYGRGHRAKAETAAQDCIEFWLKASSGSTRDASCVEADPRDTSTSIRPAAARDMSRRRGATAVAPGQGDASAIATRRDASAPADTTQAVAAREATQPEGPRDACAWCEGPIPEGKRRDSRSCSKTCRQALSRFRVGPASARASGRAMSFAYADPPYPGMARRCYGREEVDHEELIGRLCRDFPDGWALSTSADALQGVLALCPPRVRVCVWVRGVRAVRSRVALNAWEPVIIYRGRVRSRAEVGDLGDVLIWGGRQHSHPGALVGMKSAPFCEWLFRLLGAAQGDSLCDVFPGSRAVSRAWELFTSPPRTSAPSRLAEANRRIEGLTNA